MISERRRQQMRDYRARNLEACRQRNRDWCNRKKAEDPEAWRLYQRKLRGRPVATRPAPEFCESCGRAETREGKTLALDHDHSTGAFRGWLCHNCNLALGLLADSPEFIARLAIYLKASR